MNENNEKWYRKSFAIIAFLIFFFPVGLLLMWMSKWNPKVKWVITGIFVFFVGVYAIGDVTAKPSTLTLTNLEGDKTVSTADFTIEGKTEPKATSLQVNGKSADFNDDGTFSYKLSLKEGQNDVSVVAFNFSKKTEVNRRITRELNAAETSQKEAQAKEQEQSKQKKDNSEKELDGNLNFGAPGIKLQNNEDKDWLSCRFKLNDGVFGGGYSYDSNTDIPAKDTLIVAWSAFTKGDGTRFNYSTTSPKSVYVSCKVDSSDRYNYFTIGE